jgi:Arc/MetJ-type ribon-helix-helix transcriptional regulator
MLDNEMPKRTRKPRDYTTVSIPFSLTERIEDFLKTGEAGYQNRTDFVLDAIRMRLRQLGLLEPENKPILEHYNLDEHGVRILDRSLANKTSKGRIIDVYFKPDNVWCDYCESSSCRHVEFAMDIPEVQEILRKKGWKPK